MQAKQKTHLGTMACMCCGHEIPVKASANGTLHATCPWCDFPAYVKAGTEAHRIVSGKVKGKTVPTPEPAPKPVPAAPAEKPVAKPASIFHMGG